MTNFAKNKSVLIFHEFILKLKAFQVKSHFRVVFHIWYFYHYHYFILRLVRVTYITILVKQNSKFDDPYLRDKWPALREFWRSTKPLPIFSSNVKISV